MAEASPKQGLMKGRITFKAKCECTSCGAIESSSGCNQFNITTAPVSEFIEMIPKLIAGAFIQPPIGWSMNGRGNFRCPKCTVDREEKGAKKK